MAVLWSSSCIRLLCKSWELLLLALVINHRNPNLLNIQFKSWLQLRGKLASCFPWAAELSFEHLAVYRNRTQKIKSESKKKCAWVCSHSEFLLLPALLLETAHRHFFQHCKNALITSVPSCSLWLQLSLANICNIDLAFDWAGEASFLTSSSSAQR